jgi:hypothetical protein
LLDAEFDRKNKSIETDELSLKDDRRDTIVTEIIHRVDFHSKFFQNDAEKEAARLLKFITDAYRDAPNKEYQAETSYIRNMVTELPKSIEDSYLFHIKLLTLHYTIFMFIFQLFTFKYRG